MPINLLLAIASTALFLILLESGAKLIGLQPGAFLTPREDNCVKRSALLRYEFRSSCQGSIEETYFRTNSLGLRGEELHHDGARRILCMGDSCTWGWRMKQDESYPAVLQQLLDTRLGPGRFEVLNAGVPGYTSYQGLVYLRERGLALRPSIVVVAYGFNDTFRGGDVEEQLAQMRQFMPVVHLDDFLLDWSTLYSWLRWRVRDAVQPNLSARVSPEKYERNMAQTIRLARDHGAKVLVVSFWSPIGQAVKYREAIENVSEKLNVPMITYIGSKLDVVHPTVRGYRDLAEEIFDEIQADGFLK